MSVHIRTYRTHVCMYMCVCTRLMFDLLWAFFFLDKDHCTFQMTPAWGKSRVLMIETDKVSPSLPHVIYENASSPQSSRDRVCWLLGNPRHLLNLLLWFSCLGGCQQWQPCLPFCGCSCCLPSALCPADQHPWGGGPCLRRGAASGSKWICSGSSNLNVNASVILPSTAKVVWVFGDLGWEMV